MSEFSLDYFLSQFAVGSIQVSERFAEVQLTFELSDRKSIDLAKLRNALMFLNARDTLHLSMIVDEGESLDYYSGNNLSDFVEDVNNKLSILEDELVVFTIRIIKSISNGILSIYDYNSFLAYLAQSSVQAALYEFNSYIFKSNFLIFEFQTNEPITKTKSIWFVNRGFTGIPQMLDRIPIINNAKASCHFNYLPKYSLVAEDFSVTTSESPVLENIFDKLVIVLSVAFLFDITSLQNNTLEYRLNGYKSINGSADLESMKNDQDKQYYKIYNWVYDSGNFTDKIGLARNIISLHLEGISQIELKGNPFTSIQSSYKVYEKQNIKQYIEIRNKISDQLLGFHDRANRIIDTFASGFQKSSLALLSFYISAIVIKILGNSDLTGIFTFDASILSSAFVFCVYFYYLVAKWEVEAQRERFCNNYNNLKERYSDLLNEQDIDRILNGDKEFKEDIAFIDSKLKQYKFLWLLFLGILLSITWYLFFTYNPPIL